MNINEVTIKDFNFGDVNGSEESQEPRFQDLYYDEGSKIENQVKSKKKFIIYGRKGTGKTLLASYINEKNKELVESSSKIVAYDEFILEKLKEFNYDSVKREEQSLFWRYFFLQQFADLIGEDLEKLSFWQVYQKNKIKKFIKDVKQQFWEVQQLIDETTVGSEVSSQLGTSVSDAGSHIGTRISSSNTRTIHGSVSPYFKKYQILESLIEDYLSKSSKKYTIFFDDLDRLEETIPREEFLYLMISMINGAHALNKKLPDNSKIVILLRSDVIKLLFGKSGDINKLVTSGGVELRWYDSNSKASANPLMKMIFYKMSQSIDGEIPLEVIREQFFSRKETVFTYIMARTFGRPRDVVAFFNIYKDRFTDDRKILIDHLRESEKEYSEWFYREISNELKMTGEFDEIDEVIRAISELGKGEFTYHKLRDFLIKRERNCDKLLSYLSILVNQGVLGIRLHSGNVEFRYRDFNIDKPVNIHTIFVVHYGLRKLFSTGIDKSKEPNISYE
ncbi:TPA: hypothetical protein U2B54_000970 [Streptococcus suis]|nr:hypothetical protein [Streptococcus suis]